MIGTTEPIPDGTDVDVARDPKDLIAVVLLVIGMAITTVGFTGWFSIWIGLVVLGFELTVVGVFLGVADNDPVIPPPAQHTSLVVRSESTPNRRGSVAP
jgi:hypothetical protein